MRSIFTFIFIFFIWCNNSFAQNTYASITCHVYNEGSNKPIVHASITVNTIKAGQTDSLGNILLENIAPGKYLIWAAADKYYAKKTDSIFISDTENRIVEIGLRELPTGCRFNPNLYFDELSYQLTNESRVILDSLAKVLREYKDVKIEFRGNSDTYESGKGDTTLSYQRAKAAKDYLVELGIENSRLSVRGLGSTRPIAPDNYPNGKKNIEGCKLNRNVNFSIIALLKK